MKRRPELKPRPRLSQLQEKPQAAGVPEGAGIEDVKQTNADRKFTAADRPAAESSTIQEVEH